MIHTETHFVLCIHKGGDDDLELRKAYAVYPADCFVPLELPQNIERVLLAAQVKEQGCRMLRKLRRRLYSQAGLLRFDVQLVRHRLTDAPRFIWGVNATLQSKYIRHNIPHPAYFRFRRVHPCYYRKARDGSFIDKFAGRDELK